MTTPRTVAFHTLGCKLNYAETSSVRRLFENDGYTVVPYDEEADIYVLNTCSVTDNADRECRKSVRHVQRLNPQAKVVVMGCYAQLKPIEIASIQGVNLVLGTAEKFRVLDYLHALDGSHQQSSVHADDILLADTFHPAYSMGSRTRSFLKVQDGCDYKCTFCTIPQARGKSRSAEIKDVVAQAKTIGQSGVHEIVLTGVNIGDFGKGHFINLVKALDQIREISRFRISSIEPNLCTNEIIDYVASSERFMPHFHMPLQSGNNEILSKMRRRYRRELYEERVNSIRAQMPHACIGVDVITGFPGESDFHFKDTFHFLEDLEIDYIHAFTYSERENTPASTMPDAVPIHTRRERSNALRNLSLKKKKAHYSKHIGETRNVLFENGDDTNSISGFTDNYIRVCINNSPSLANTIQEVELHHLNFSEGDPVVWSFLQQSERLLKNNSPSVTELWHKDAR